MTVKTRTAHARLTAAQFARLEHEHPHVNRPRTRQAMYARAVLVDGDAPVAVATRHGVSPQMVRAACKLFLDLDIAVRVAKKGNSHA